MPTLPQKTIRRGINMNTPQKERWLITQILKNKTKCPHCKRPTLRDGQNIWCNNNNCPLNPTTWNMTEICTRMALYLFNAGTEVYRLYDDGTEGVVEEEKEIHDHDGIFGVEY